MPQDGPLLLRFLAKLLIDVVPAAVASIIGGILFTHYQMGYGGAAKPAAEQAAPASAEMVKLLRDEHAVIVDFLKAQTAAEKSRQAVEDEESARSVAEAKMAAAAPAPIPAAVTPVAPAPAAAPAAPSRRPEPTVMAAKSGTNRGRALAAATAATPHAPLVIAQAEQSGGNASAAPAAGNSESLLSRTLDFKDRVVDATLHVIGTIGSIPSLIASGGDRAGGPNANVPVGRMVGAPS
jgi:type IV secretory pathway VirB10-like protein